MRVNEVKTKKGVDLLQHLVEYYHAQHKYCSKIDLCSLETKKNNSVKPSKPCPSFNSMQQKLGKKILRPVKLNEIVCTCY